MEELRSTEILDKEIEADARKKAERLLSDADAECQKLLDAVDGRVKEASEQKKTYYDAKIATFKKNRDAALPLEQERYRVSFYTSSVADAFNAYLEKLGQEKQLSLIESMLVRSKHALTGKNVHALVFGISAADAKKLLEKHLESKQVLSCTETTFEKSGDEAVLMNNVHKGIILESEDSSVRVRLTIDQLVGEIEDRYSNELATTLFGGRLPE
ncbi:MAG: hypothetical protein II684_07205 [Treponema sp.]|nr:hypothetical protein [Treponema sp.]MBR4464677.1 hypothetical protein [Treponema sp.]